jgi:spermidine synthase
MPGSRVKADVWISEYMTPYDVYQHGVVNILAHKRTAYQEMYIVDSGVYGKGLVLDGKWQSCTGDEFLYHEALVHPSCCYHGDPRRVLVLGGGEGATVREVLKWKSVEKVVMVDIDRDVVEACRQHLPEMHQGAFDDPRTELVIGDALEALGASENEWDIIISDLSDPIEEGPSFELFTREYFEKCRRALKPDGYFVIQAGPTAPPEMALHVRLVNTVKVVFEHVAAYVSHVPTYASPYGFALGSARPINVRPDPAAVDEMLAEKTTRELKMFDGAAMLGLMSTPKYLRDAIKAETRVYTLDEPPRFFGEGIGRR